MNNFHKPLKDFEKRIQDVAKELLTEKFGVCPNFCIATTGSDARNEKIISDPRSDRSSSPLELIIIYDNSLSSSKSEDLQNLKKITESHSNFFDSFIEVQNLEEKRVLTVINQKDRLVLSPSRAIDAICLYGNPEIMEKYKDDTFNDLKGLTPKRKKTWKANFLKKEQEKLQDTLTGKSRFPVDIEKGTLEYDNDRVRSTKYSLLRVVQYRLVLFLIDSIKKESIDKETFLQMPHSIAERITWLSENNLWTIPLSDAMRFAKAYDQALGWYFDSQRAFEKGQTQINVDPIELQNVATTLNELVSRNSKDLLP